MKDSHVHTSIHQATPSPWWFIRICLPALLAGLILLNFVPAKAAENNPAVMVSNSLGDQVRLADLIEYAYGHNPGIIKAREAWRATVENYRVTTGYPDPQLMVTWFPEPIETRLGPQDWNAQISQMIPFPRQTVQGR